MTFHDSYPSSAAHMPGHITQPSSNHGTGPLAGKGKGGLTSGQQSVYDLLNSTLASWGLSSLSGDLRKLILEGDTAPDTLSLALSQTKAYKLRFAGNELRKAQGLPELTPAEYIAAEEQYSNVMRAYGLPKGFYDKHEDFTKLIGGDVSPAELQTRAQIAHDEYLSAPAETKALWSQYFGKGDIIAGLLDPNVATQVLQDRATQVAIGGEAAQNGFHVGQGRAQQFQQAGVSLAQARQAYQRIGQTFGTDQTIASRFGQQFGQTQEENELLLGNGAAANQRQALYGNEQALFKGHGALDQQSLGVNTNI